jgi:uncharacterized membrane protein
MFDKLDAYNLVANLVPGAALIYALHSSGFPTPKPADIGAFVLVSFVAGVLTNRLGSLALDPILRHKKIRFLHPKNYKAFITSEKEDEKLDTIVANTGLYRTFVTAGIVYIILMTMNILIKDYGLSNDVVFSLFVIAGIIISAFALRKEDNYIHQRIGRAPSDEGKGT